MRVGTWIVCVVLFSAVASADVTDGVLAAAKEKDVIVTLADGKTVVGKLASYGKESIVLVDDEGELAEYDRSKIAKVKLAKPPSRPPVPPKPEKARPPDDYTPVCSLYDTDEAVEITTRSGAGYATASAKDAVARIGAAIGMQGIPDVFEGSVPNAMATFYGQRRVIIYNSGFMDTVAGKAGTRWAYTAVLAHELGHHLNFHVSAKSTSDSWHQELEADYFAGFALAKMGATLDEAKSAMRTLEKLYGPNGSATHPAPNLRLAEIEKGYRDGKPPTPPTPPSKATEERDGEARPSPPAPPPSPPPPPPQPQPVQVAFGLNGNVVIKVNVAIDGVAQGSLATLPDLGPSSGVVTLLPGRHNIVIQGLGQVCNQFGCQQPFPVQGSSDFHASSGAQFLITGMLTPVGFTFAMNPVR